MPDPGLPIADMGPDPDADLHRAPTPRAAELPDGTVVARRDKVWIKDHPTDWSQWRTTYGSYEHNSHVDDAVEVGARVLRYGYDGSES